MMEIIENNEAPKIIKSDNIKKNLIKNLEYDNEHENDLKFWKDKWFEKVPSWEDFAKWWFQRSEIIMLINIIIELLEVEENDKFNIEYWEVVNHFVRNGSLLALISEDYNKRRLIYDNFIYFIDLIRKFDDNQSIIDGLFTVEEYKELSKLLHDMKKNKKA